MHKLIAAQFLIESEKAPIIDVRTPAEYEQGHIPGAYNVPLFTNEQRVLVGTAYKRQGREAAMLLALDLVGPRMRELVEAVQKITEKYMTAHGEWPAASFDTFSFAKAQENTQDERVVSNHATNTKKVLIHCWRGGMRSASFAWLCQFFGFEVSLLDGGYKAYRAWVREQFAIKRNFIVLGGPTGLGKTEILLQLVHAQEQAIDLELLAQHKGSVFGGLGQQAQPTQEQFENNLAQVLTACKTEKRIFIEDESRKIGALFVPEVLYAQMRIALLVSLARSQEERVAHLCKHYGAYDVELLIACVTRLEKHIGGARMQEIIKLLEACNIQDVCKLLIAYYDALYAYGLSQRAILNKLNCDISELSSSQAAAAIQAALAQHNLTPTEQLQLSL